MNLERKKDLIKPDQTTSGTGSGVKNQFYTGIPTIGDNGYFPCIWKPSNSSKTVKTSFGDASEKPSDEVKLLNNLNCLVSTVLKQVIYIPDEGNNQAESQISKILGKLSDIEGNLNRRRINENFNLVKKKLDLLIARPEFLDNPELLEDIKFIKSHVDKINLDPIESKIESVQDSINKISFPELDTTSIIDSISKLRTDVRKIKPATFDTSKLESLIKNQDKNLKEIKEKLEIFNLKDLEASINHIAENLPKLKPLIDRQNAAHQILRHIATHLGVDQNLIDAITIPEEKDKDVKTFKITK